MKIKLKKRISGEYVIKNDNRPFARINEGFDPIIYSGSIQDHPNYPLPTTRVRLAGTSAGHQARVVIEDAAGTDLIDLTFLIKYVEEKRILLATVQKPLHSSHDLSITLIGKQTDHLL
jgi:hypothetical protein